MTSPSRYAPAGGWLLVATVVHPILAMASPFGTLFAGSPPATLGAPDGKLPPCPERPNCVSSRAPDGDHMIAPLAFRGGAAAAMTALVDVIRAMPGATVITARPDYVHAEFASAVFGFVDDVEFVPDFGTDVIHVRSAARLGVSDFGINRKRVEAIRSAFAAATR
jgi:uncharacterized protein (DUF1499 family)